MSVGGNRGLLNLFYRHWREKEERITDCGRIPCRYLSPLNGDLFGWEIVVIKKMKRMNLFLEVESQDPNLSSELMKRPEKIGIKADLPASAIIMKVHSSVEGKEMFLLSFGNKVAPSLLANWLYERISGRANKLWMGRIEVPIDTSEIERVIAERIESY